MTENNDTILNSFFQRLGHTRRGLLLLDYDGTMAPFVENRHEAYPAPGLRDAVNETLGLPGNRTVIVTGRTPQEVLDLLQPSEPIEVWGCHGREYRNLDGNITIHGVTEVDRQALDEGARRIRRESIVEENRIDEKTGCLAIHWRGRESDQASIEEKARQQWQPLVDESGLQILNFNGGIELCVPGRTKGDAINALLEDIDTSQVCVAFLGDDLTDEDGFKALGDRGLSVLVKNEPRETLAPVRLTMPEGIHSFLRRWSKTLKGDASA